MYDTRDHRCDIMVAGSARPIVYRRGSDSLLGRYYHFRLSPFSLREMHTAVLNSPGPFPEPRLAQDEQRARIWRRNRDTLIVREDLRDALDDGDYEWAAFAAHQAAEKAVKALVLGSAGELSGHSVTALVEAFPYGLEAPREVEEAARRLDKHYIPTRYPNGFPSGYPGKFYTQGKAEAAITDAETLIEFCRRHLPR